MRSKKVAMLQVFDDLPVFELPDGRRSFALLQVFAKLSLRSVNILLSFSTKTAAGSAAQGFQAVGTCPGKEIEHGFLLDKVA